MLGLKLRYAFPSSVFVLATLIYGYALAWS